MKEELFVVGRTVLLIVLAIGSTLALVLSSKLTVTTAEWFTFLGSVITVYAGKSVGHAFAEAKRPIKKTPEDVAAVGAPYPPGRRNFTTGGPAAGLIALLLLPLLLMAPAHAQQPPELTIGQVPAGASGYWLFEQGGPTVFLTGIEMGKQELPLMCGAGLLAFLQGKHDTTRIHCLKATWEEPLSLAWDIYFVPYSAVLVQYIQDNGGQYPTFPVVGFGFELRKYGLSAGARAEAWWDSQTADRHGVQFFFRKLL